MHDPDGGDFLHWIIYEIPNTATGLSANIEYNTTTPSNAPAGSKQEFSDWGYGAGYGGPSPPTGTASIDAPIP